MPGLLVAALTACALGGCTDSPRLGPTRGYILISVDTLRADPLGCYGYERDTSPEIDSLAARGILFEQAYAQVPSTLESHMTMFTGLYPDEHGVAAPAGVLPPEIATLPELFRQRGFRTAGFTEGGFVHGGYGFSRGFEQFRDDSLKIETDIERTLDRGIDFLQGLNGDERFFLFLHTYSVHDPYFPQAELLRRFWPAERPDTFAPTGPNLLAVNRGEMTVTARAVAFFEAAYDASIRYADQELGRFFDRLTRLGLDDEVTILLTSDHGEEFLEHGKLVHQQAFPETLHVPLLLLHPSITEPSRVSALVETVDIAPTLQSLAGLEAPLPLSGQSLLPLLGRQTPRASEAFSRSADGRTRVLLSRQGRHWLMAAETGPESPSPWVLLSREFDWTGPLRFEARSFHRQRQLRIETDGALSDTRTLEPDRWQTIDLPLAGDRLSRVELSSPDCDVPAQVGSSRDERCLSFAVRGIATVSVDLFDLSSDPGATHDLAPERLEETASLRRRLSAYQRSPVAPVNSQPLDPELVKHLKAVGYLQ